MDDSECNDAREDGRDDSDSDLSADTEYNWLDHVRRDRAKINKILLGGTKRKNKKKRADGIPVFSYKGPVDELPPNVLIIGSGGGDDDEKHRSSIDVVRTSGGSSKNSQVLQRLTPFVTIPTIEHILGLSKIRKRLKEKYTRIIVSFLLIEIKVSMCNSHALRLISNCLY